MAADILTLKRIYRLLSTQKATISDSVKGLQLSDQLAWLLTQFTAHATAEDAAGGSQVSQDTFEGSSTTLVFPGSTVLERSTALEELINDINYEIAGTFNPRGRGWFTPQFSHIPR